jgi:hypothetical protein
MGSTPSPLVRFHHHADLAGVTASTICLIHCLLTPVVISLFPNIIPYLPGDASFHRLLAVGILLFGLVGFLPGYLVHRRKSLLALIAAGIALILVVAWSGESLHQGLELFLSVSGSVFLVVAHLLNRSFCRGCRSCADAAEPCATTTLS